MNKTKLFRDYLYMLSAMELIHRLLFGVDLSYKAENMSGNAREELGNKVVILQMK